MNKFVMRIYPAFPIAMDFYFREKNRFMFSIDRTGHPEEEGSGLEPPHLGPSFFFHSLLGGDLVKKS